MTTTPGRRRRQWMIPGLLGLLGLLWVEWPHAHARTPQGESLGIRYAKGFSVSYEGECTLIRTRAVRDGGTLSFAAAQTLLLVPPGITAPVIPGATVIPIPVQRVGVNFPTEIGMLKALDLLDRVVATCLPDSYPQIVKGIQEGRIRVTGLPGRFNIESLVSSRPDLVLAFCQSNVQKNYYDQARRYGLPAVLVHSYMEATPLARAEWIKFIACFFGREDRAEKLFTRVVSDYHQLQAYARQGAKNKPTAFWVTGSPKSWTANRNGFAAALMADAGAANILYRSDLPSQTKISDELLVRLAAGADYWLSDHSQQARLAGKAAGRFKAFREHRLYDSQKPSPQLGFSEYFGMGDVHPEWVLADLIAIFHPHLMPRHTFRFFQRQRSNE